MKLYNPTSNDLTIVYLGVPYTIKANASEDLPVEVAEHWKTHIHQFLEEVEEAAKPTKAAKVEDVEEVVKEAAPKAKK